MNSENFVENVEKFYSRTKRQSFADTRLLKVTDNEPLSEKHMYDVTDRVKIYQASLKSVVQKPGSSKPRLATTRVNSATTRIPT